MDKIGDDKSTKVKKLINIMSAESEIKVPYDEKNGLLIFNDKYIPDELMIELFCHYIDHNSLRSCQSVCKRWNFLIQSYRIWRRKAEMTIHHCLPIVEDAPWRMYYLICDKKPFYRNLIKKHSGQKGWKSKWHIISNSGGGWVVESPPVGVPNLPKDPIFQNTNHCFVNSFEFCWKEQIIDLIKEGASDYLLDEMQPTIKISEWYSCRRDCPAVYVNEVELRTESNEVLDSHQFSRELRGVDQNKWFKFEHEFKNYGKGLRKILFAHGGQDRKIWAGHYGSKMAGACIILKFPEIKNSSIEE